MEVHISWTHLPAQGGGGTFLKQTWLAQSGRPLAGPPPLGHLLAAIEDSPLSSSHSGLSEHQGLILVLKKLKAVGKTV